MSNDEIQGNPNPATPKTTGLSTPSDPAPPLQWQPLPPLQVKVSGLPPLARFPIQKQIKHLQTRVTELESISSDELISRYHSLKPAAQRVLLARGGLKNLRKPKTRKALATYIIDAVAIASILARGTTGLKAHPNQLAAAYILANGALAQVGTGEGKTLVGLITLPALNLLGPVHVATANSYLASRDRDFVAPTLALLSIRTALVHSEATDAENRASYLADVVYSTASQLGFDYLRDSLREIDTLPMQRKAVSALIDEADSLLIDEASTPLIISNPTQEATEQWAQAATVLASLTDEDVELKKSEGGVSLTDSGFDKVSQAYGVGSIYESTENFYYLDAMLRAGFLLTKDQDYIVGSNPKSGNPEVQIIDAITGRISHGRRFTDGIHEALEAKEGLPSAGATKTMAQITIQALFRNYAHLAGMSGTLTSAREEIATAFKLDVIEIPPHFPSQRIDEEDVIYRRVDAKIDALVADVKIRHALGQPVLIGTTSVDESLQVSEVLSKNDLPHSVLNAKENDKESHIIAQAGRVGAITVATNMAGRGVDILLGGNPAELAAQDWLTQSTPAAKEAQYSDELLYTYTKLCARDRLTVIALGGLAVIGSSRQVARRVDEQLRGRAGRQGEPGLSKFYLSTEDELVKIWGGDNIGILVTKLAGEPGAPVKKKSLAKATLRAQRLLEGNLADSRSQLLRYESVITSQRDAVAAWRESVLRSDDETIIRAHITPCYREILTKELAQIPFHLYTSFLSRSNLDPAMLIKLAAVTNPEHLEYEDYIDYHSYLATSAIAKALQLPLPAKAWPVGVNAHSSYENIPAPLELTKSLTEAVEYLTDLALQGHDQRWGSAPKEFQLALNRTFLTQEIDRAWANQGVDLTNLMQVVSLRSGKNPVAEYITEASNGFDAMKLEVAFAYTATMAKISIDLSPEKVKQLEQLAKLKKASEGEPDEAKELTKQAI